MRFIRSFRPNGSRLGTELRELERVYEIGHEEDYVAVFVSRDLRVWRNCIWGIIVYTVRDLQGNVLKQVHQLTELTRSTYLEKSSPK